METSSKIDQENHLPPLHHRIKDRAQNSPKKAVFLILSVLALPVLVGAALVVQNTTSKANTNNSSSSVKAAEASPSLVKVIAPSGWKKNRPSPIVMGMSLWEGYSSRDEKEPLAFQALDNLAKPAAQGGIGRYPATFSIWTDIGGSGASGPRQDFPSQRMLDYLDERKITPVIFM